MAASRTACCAGTWWRRAPAFLIRQGTGWEVRHVDGACPPTEELWEIQRGVPGRYGTRPERWTPAGTVLRSTLHDYRRPFPDTAPGFHRVREGEATAIVTTVRERRPEYCRDEDGNQPAELIGEDGWYFRILVRPATAEEAADILAEEDTQQRRAALAARRRRLFERGDDGEVPETVDLSGAVQVDFGALRSLHQHWPDDELHVDEQTGAAWFLRYNGADGDDWSLSNHGSFIARRMPLTQERAQLVAGAGRVHTGRHPCVRKTKERKSVAGSARATCTACRERTAVAKGLCLRCYKRARAWPPAR